jgi:hypothetical protein
MRGSARGFHRDVFSKENKIMPDTRKTKTQLSLLKVIYLGIIFCSLGSSMAPN